MKAREGSIPGLWEFVPDQFPDARGNFLVWYDAAVFADALGYPLTVGQTNHSVSHRGTIRGVHWADVPPGQAKYIYCPQGAVLDIIVDLRVGSPTFGRHEVVRLDQVDYRAVYLSEGLGHSFIGLDDVNVLSYLCSARYSPTTERVINPMDADLALPWPEGVEPILSDRDVVAPSLRDIQAAGLLPSYEQCQRFYDSLRQAHRSRAQDTASS